MFGFGNLLFGKQVEEVHGSLWPRWFCGTSNRNRRLRYHRTGIRARAPAHGAKVIDPQPGYSGATFITSSAVVCPAATFIAPDARSGFIPSRYACSRNRARSTSARTRCLAAGVMFMIS